jgi:hypothetical protein
MSCNGGLVNALTQELSSKLGFQRSALEDPIFVTEPNESDNQTDNKGRQLVLGLPHLFATKRGGFVDIVQAFRSPKTLGSDRW